MNKEIADLTKRITRLTQIRDSLLPDASPAGIRGKADATAVAPLKAKRKKTTAKKAAPVNSAPGKRIVSAATRKKMSDAAKKRAAARKASTAK
ncbi:hypothetical protein GRAN_5230 [Granulicella sibirica]|uniref:Uncharacterized protein n=1 Tax=Granulicella sibirica TaxID=2479048 RepID=A0A4Q0SU92_9BACT|nr:hypothetical protein GRAN_5230 [Granulicella sibirica]